MRWFGLMLSLAALGAGAYSMRGELFRLRDSGAMSLGQRTRGRAPSDDRRGLRRIFAGGVVEGTQRDVALRFETSGRVNGIFVHEGDRVARGTLLAELDAQTLRQRVAEAEARLNLARSERERLVNGARPETREVLRADVKLAKVRVREARTLWNRSQQLAERKAVSAQELDDHRFEHEKAVASLLAAQAKLTEIEAPARADELAIAEARIALAEASLRHEQSNLEKASLRAPVDGVVLHILTEPGELVGPEDERSLITMTNRDRTRIRAYVEELDALCVGVGQQASVSVDGNAGRDYKGRVVSCSPFVRGKSNRHHKPGELIDVKVREVVIELSDADELVVGLPVDVFIDRTQPTASRDGPRETASARVR